MNPKRRKLDDSGPSLLNSVSVQRRSAESVSSTDKLSSAHKALNSRDEKEVMKALNGLKEVNDFVMAFTSHIYFQKLCTKEEVLSFIEKDRPCYRMLITLFQRSASEVLGARFEYILVKQMLD